MSAEQVPPGTKMVCITADRRTRDYRVDEPWPYRRSVVVSVNIPGYTHTIPLDTPVTLRRGDQFCLTITLPDCLTFKQP